MSLDSASDPFPIEKRSLKALALLQVKRTFDLFQGADWENVPLDEKAQKTKIACKVCHKIRIMLCVCSCLSIGPCVTEEQLPWRLLESRR